MTTPIDYAAFLDSKRISAEPVGFAMDDDAINPMLFPFQRDIVRWAIGRGRAALFCDCGLNQKTRRLRGFSDTIDGTAPVLETPNAAPDQPSWYQQEVAMSHSTRRVPKIDLTCAECGARYSLYPSQAKHNRSKYCSRACLGRSKRHGSVLYCDLCDEPFYRQFAEQDAVHHFCSRDCYMQWRAINRKPDSYPKDGAVHLHRIVAERVLGRTLRPGEIVHHIDLDKHNAEPSNLAVFPDQSTHARCHFGSMSAAELDSYRLVEVRHGA